MLVCITAFLCSFALVAYTMNAWSKLEPLALLLFNSISIVQVWNLDCLDSRLVADHKFLKVWTVNILHILQVLNSLSHSDSCINKKINERSFFRFRVSGNIPFYLLIKLGSKQVNPSFPNSGTSNRNCLGLSCHSLASLSTLDYYLIPCFKKLGQRLQLSRSSYWFRLPKFTRLDYYKSLA